MKRLTPDEFTEAARTWYTDEQLGNIRRDAALFEDQGGWFGIIFEPELNRAFITDAFGEGMAWIQSLRESMHKLGIEKVGFLTQENGLLTPIAKYYKALGVKTGNKYKNGRDEIFYVVDMKGRRLWVEARQTEKVCHGDLLAKT